MLDPRDWKYEDRWRLLLAAAFGALLGFTNGYSHGPFNLLVALVGAVVVGGAFYCYRAFR
jgi:CHASE2 domain-containing sensor protein